MTQDVARATVTAASPPRHLADWIEIRCLTGTGACSQRDLISAIRQDGSLDAVDEDAIYEQRDDEELESRAEDTLLELMSRSQEIGDAYPFVVGEDGVLEATPEAASSVYVFLMLVSKMGADAVPGGFKLFDALAQLATEAYLGPLARVILFGHPRSGPVPSGFYEALIHVFHDEMRDGTIRERDKLPRAGRAKDDRVDLIAWVPIGTDYRSGRLIALGQCSTGHEDPAQMSSKANEISVALWQDWFEFSPTAPPVLMFFCPHRVPPDRWRDISLLVAGVFFDRTRLAVITHEGHEETVATLADWSRQVIAGIVENGGV